jgi:mannose-6-phosphate isomerase-like protein (cupin superfamily)
MSRKTGEKVENIRILKKLSRNDLAVRVGMTEKMIASIEKGEEIPSLTPLIKIARALGVRLGTFLDDTDVQGPVVSKKDNLPTATSFSSSSPSANSYLNFLSLARDKSGRHMEPFLMDIQPTDSHDYVLSSHEGEEFIYVLEGEIEVSYGKESYILTEGDSIYYDSIVKHNVHSTSDQPAKILAVVYAPF